MLSYLGHILKEFSQKGRATLLQIIKPIGLHDSCKEEENIVKQMLTFETE
jgi:hypothetical protein